MTPGRHLTPDNIFGEPAHRVEWRWDHATAEQADAFVAFVKKMTDVQDAGATYVQVVTEGAPGPRVPLLRVHVRLQGRSATNAEDLVGLYATLWWNQYEGNPNRADREWVEVVPHDSPESG